MAKKKNNREAKAFMEAHKALHVRFDQDVADHSQELLWGQGFKAALPEGTGNDRLQDILHYNQASKQFSHLEKLLSLFGNIYTTIDMIDGKPTWTIADPYLNSTGMAGNITADVFPTTNGSIYGMGRAMVTDMVAVIWKRITYGTIMFPIKEVWDREKVVRYFYGENNKEITLEALNKKIPKEMQVTKEWKHNMGFVPVIWHQNLPVFNTLSPSDGYKGKDIQELADHTLTQQWYETATNRTRLFGSMDEAKYAELLKSGQLSKMVVQDLLINVPNKNSAGGEVNQLIPLMGDPKLETYNKGYNALKDEYFKLAGYSPLGDGATEKTATENLLMKTGDYQTTKKKRNLRTDEINRLLKYSLEMDAKWGFGDIFGNIQEDLSFEIMENKVMDSMNEIANWKLLIDNDLASKIEAIADIRGVTLEKARAIFEQIMEDKKLHYEAEADLVDAVGVEIEDHEVEQEAK